MLQDSVIEQWAISTALILFLEILESLLAFQSSLKRIKSRKNIRQI